MARVLIIDDEEQIQSLLRTTLEHLVSAFLFSSLISTVVREIVESEIRAYLNDTTLVS